MIQRIKDFLTRSLGVRSKPPKVASFKDLQAIRTAMLSGVKDCEGLQAQRLHLKISSAATAQDLWLLRNDAYLVISQQYDQAVAAGRINQLMHAFEGWVDARQLVAIR
jgi:hypothetical protein